MAVPAMRRMHGESLFRECCAQHIEHGAFAAEEMRGAGHVQQQAVGCLERDERREAVAPVRDLFQQLQSAASSAMATEISGTIARALASGMPRVRPKASALGLVAESLSAFCLFGGDDQSALYATALALSRSVARHGNHSARMRRAED